MGVEAGKRTAIIGIDYSMTSPGVCIIEPGTGRLRLFNLTQRKSLPAHYSSPDGRFTLDIMQFPAKKFPDDILRFTWISKQVHEFIIRALPQQAHGLVAIEGYSYGSTNRILEICENTMALKLRVYNDPRLTLHQPSPPPTTVKKHAAGKGNADKEGMVAAFQTRTGIDLPGLLGLKPKDSPVSDIADAFWVADWLDVHQKNLRHCA